MCQSSLLVRKLRITTLRCHQLLFFAKIKESQEPRTSQPNSIVRCRHLIASSRSMNPPRSHLQLQVPEASPQTRPLGPPLALNHALCRENGRCNPQAELRRCQDCDTTTCHAHRAVTESYIAQTNGHGNESGKVEDAVGDFNP